ncbi:hypothetical protein [Yoonia sp. BS5-3]|uniref:Uncharacterized protein n=1 Tax=Yoonia phaeophyticola TaxID=3137369 RepID=A0ABZ3IDL5_9RHOB
MFVKDIRSEKWNAYRAYALTAAVTIAISLAFDFVDISLWIGGERQSVLEGFD